MMCRLADHRWLWWIAAAVADVAIAAAYMVDGKVWWGVAGFVIAAGCLWAAYDEWRDRWVK